MNINIVLFLVMVLCHGTLQAQISTGINTNQPNAYDGYTLFHPDFQYNTYLIDNDGIIHHSWPSDYFPGRSVYLLENQMLLRTGVDTSAVYGTGGSGGYIELVAWNGQVVWRYKISDEVYLQHHDVAYLPNGNILAIVWHRRSVEEAISMGRDPEMVGDSFWSEVIWEIKPIGSNGAEIVWKWDLWDHLVQDFDDALNGYGDVSASWEKIDINYNGNKPPLEDFVHMNAIDFLPERDHIVLSANRFNEVWIIDHGITEEEAAGTAGDLLFRWGNPGAYKDASEKSQTLFGQHDAEWVQYSGEGYQLLIYNNNRVNGEVTYSTIDLVSPVWNDSASLYDGIEEVFTSTEVKVLYEAENQSEFWSAILSGAQLLPNGNLFICEGIRGRLFEVDSSGEIVWSFYSPFTKIDGILCSFEEVPYGASIFRGTKLSIDYPGLSQLTPTGSTNIKDLCTSDVLAQEIVSATELKCYPNPSSTGQITIRGGLHAVYIYDMTGRIVYFSQDFSDSLNLDLQGWSKGQYIVKSGSASSRFIVF